MLAAAISAWELPAWGTGVLAARGLALPVSGLTGVGKELNQVIFPFFLSSSLLNLLTYLSLTSRNLSSLTILMNCWHLSIILSDTIDASFDLLNSLFGVVT